MLKMRDVLALIGAGYSRAEIDAMEAQEAITDQIPAPSPAVEPAPAPAADPVPVPAPAAEPQRDPELLEAIRGLTAAMQKTNVINSAQPGDVTPASALEKADGILTKFLNT